MELKPGYQQTEVGVIPEDWRVDVLGNCTTKVGSGITPTGGGKVYTQEGRPFLRSQNVGWGHLLLSDIAFIDEATHSTFSATEINLNDVLLNITGASIGRSAVADYRLQGGNVNQHVCIIRADTNKLVPQFLNLFLLSEKGQKQIDSFQAGGNRQGLNFGQIKSFKIPLPCPLEQRAIADVLGDMDTFLAALDTLIHKKQNIEQGAMQELFTSKLQLGNCDIGWEVKKLSEVCHSIVDGTHFTPTYVDDGIPFYSVENVTGDNFTDTKFISPEEHARLSRRCKPEKGDILLTRIGSLGDTKLIDWDVDASIYVSLALLKPNDSALGDYLYSYSKSRQFVRDVEKRSLVNATPQKINMGDIGNIPIPVPKDTNERRNIASILFDMDAEISSLKQQRDRIRLLRQGMTQELLTGRIRLV